MNENDKQENPEKMDGDFEIESAERIIIPIPFDRDKEMAISIDRAKSTRIQFIGDGPGPVAKLSGTDPDPDAGDINLPLKLSVGGPLEPVDEYVITSLVEGNRTVFDAEAVTYTFDVFTEFGSNEGKHKFTLFVTAEEAEFGH